MAATAKLALVRQLLLQATPENIDSAVTHLQEAVVRLESLKSEAPRNATGTQGELAALKQEVKRVTALLHHAGRFHLGWASFVASSGPEYGLTGSLFPTPAGSRVSFDG